MFLEYFNVLILKIKIFKKILFKYISNKNNLKKQYNVNKNKDFSIPWIINHTRVLFL